MPIAGGGGGEENRYPELGSDDGGKRESDGKSLSLRFNGIFSSGEDEEMAKRRNPPLSLSVGANSWKEMVSQ